MIYNKFKQLLIAGVPFNFLTDTIKVALMASVYEPDKVNDEFWVDIVGDEIVAVGYDTGGVELIGKTVIQGDDLVFSADELLLDIATGAQVKSIVIYREGTGPADSELICVKEFTFPKTVIGDKLKVEWPEAGIIALRS